MIDHRDERVHRYNNSDKNKKIVRKFMAFAVRDDYIYMDCWSLDRRVLTKKLNHVFESVEIMYFFFFH